MQGSRYIRGMELAAVRARGLIRDRGRNSLPEGDLLALQRRSEAQNSLQIKSRHQSFDTSSARILGLCVAASEGRRVMRPLPGIGSAQTDRAWNVGMSLLETDQHTCAATARSEGWGIGAKNPYGPGGRFAPTSHGDRKSKGTGFALRTPVLEKTSGYPARREQPISVIAR
jgi:hypothetical protein